MCVAVPSAFLCILLQNVCFSHMIPRGSHCYVPSRQFLTTCLISCHLFSVEMDPKERLARQRKLLQKKLGLDMGAAIGMDTEELFNDEDLDYTCQNSGLRGHGSKATAGSSSRNHTVGLILASLL